MSKLLILVTSIVPDAVTLAASLEIRPAEPGDTAALGRLYFRAYPPGIAGDTESDATDDIATTFAGEYGQLWPAASPVVVADGEIIAAALTVRRAPWDDTPPGPFIIELFTDPARRRAGLGRAAIGHALLVALSAGPVGLRVEDDNVAAIALYRSLGFTEWLPARSTVAAR